jgi:threonine synthase
MYYLSTRDASLRLTAAQAIARGLSRDGGLFMTSELPRIDLDFIDALRPLSYPERAARIMKLYLEDYTEEELSRYTAAAYGGNFDGPCAAPLRKLDAGTAFLELWHGPTCAFKDMALQILPYLLRAALTKTGEKKEVCILVATSGDTGKAALEGFRDVPGTKILVFYPSEGVSNVQKLQMSTQEGGNVGVCAVYGNFDDAQNGVKAIFSDGALRERLADNGLFFSSANSINWGRLLPQTVYYISAYCDAVDQGMIRLGERLNYSVPTGNFGNILAGWLAKRMGLPAGKFICASNSNNVLTDFIKTGVYDRNRRFYTTMSPSMDILISSNLERLLYAMSGDDAEVRAYMRSLSETGRYSVSPELTEKIRADFYGAWRSEEQTAGTIAEIYGRGMLIDPHTAVACGALEDYRSATGDGAPAVIVSTASAFKFCDSVLAALGRPSGAEGAELIERLGAETGAPVPAPLAGLDKRRVRFTETVEKTEMTGAVLRMLGLG